MQVFVQVCHAVQHAHQKGLIHRDIKPGNILGSEVDGKPLAKVIDFGIAKATQGGVTERTLFTEHGQLIGTPEYTSPEQASGGVDIDTRTDIYSLGVLLYELLTGFTPFDGRSLRSAAYEEIRRIIREVEPPRPSARLSQASDTIASIAAARRAEPRRLNSVTARILSRMGNNLMRAGEFAAARDPLTRSLELCRKGFDPVDWRTGMAQGRLGECLSNLGVNAEAEKLLTAGVNSMRGDPNATPDVLKSGLERLAAHYERTGDAAQAAEARRQIPATAPPAK